MKFFTSNRALFLLPLLISSCFEDNKKSSENSNTVNCSYTLIISAKRIDSTKTPGAFYIQNDSSALSADSDSAAYLKAIIKYERYNCSRENDTGKNIVEPVSFKIINRKNEDVSLNLKIPQKKKIDSVAKMVVLKEKNALNDSLENLRLINNDKNSNKNTFDTILPTRPAADKKKKVRSYPVGSTYVPI